MFSKLSTSIRGWMETGRHARRHSSPIRRQARGRFERLEDRVLLAGISPEEQLFVYLLNRARHDPAAYQQEVSLPVSLSYVTPRGPLAVNNSLFGSAGFHAEEMAQHNYFDHQSAVTGDWPNKMARDHGYPLPSGYPNNANYIESAGAGYSDAADLLYGLAWDKDFLASPGHRNHLFSIGSGNTGDREIGVGHGYNSLAYLGHRWAVHITYSDLADKFLTGVAFNDANANSRYDLGEGLAGVTINASGGLTTTTNAQGGWALKVAGNSYTVTASGGGFQGVASSVVTINAENVEVDFISGRSSGIVDFAVSNPGGVEPTTVGLYDPVVAGFHLRDSNMPRNRSLTCPAFCFGPANAGWLPLSGDWDGNGQDSIGAYNPKTATFILRNANVGGGSDLQFTYGPANAGWIPLIGDWNGDGVDTVAVYDPSTAGFHLKNANVQGGGADMVFCYGPANAGWVPLAGDWNGDSVDTVGLYDPSHAGFHLRKSNGIRPGSIVFVYGPANAGFKPIIGDWNGDRVDTVGVYDPSTAGFHLKNANVQGGGADVIFCFGPAKKGWLPITGNWQHREPAFRPTKALSIDWESLILPPQPDPPVGDPEWPIRREPNPLWDSPDFSMLGNERQDDTLGIRRSGTPDESLLDDLAMDTHRYLVR